MRTALSCLALASLLALAACGGSGDGTREAELSREAELGRRIFNDNTLSASGRLACASCHVETAGHAQANALAAQLGGPALDRQGLRSSPSIRYLAFAPAFRLDSHGAPGGGLFWDGRASTLAEQASRPFFSAAEMALPDGAALVTRLARAEYAAEFRSLYGGDVFDDPDEALMRTTQALARYQREDPDFAPFSSKFDAVQRGQAQFSSAEQRGQALFNDPRKGNCAFCHTSAAEPGVPGALFTNFSYHVLGVPRNAELAVNADPAFFDLGLCAREGGDLATRSDLCGAFRTPSLRNVALRGALFHNGRFQDPARGLGLLRAPRHPARALLPAPRRRQRRAVRRPARGVARQRRPPHRPLRPQPGWHAGAGRCRDRRPGGLPAHAQRRLAPVGPRSRRRPHLAPCSRRRPPAPSPPMVATVRRPLLWKYAATLSVLVSVLLLVGGALGAWQLYRTARQAIEQVQQAEARFAATEITAFLARVQGALRNSVAKFDLRDVHAGDDLRIELVSLLRHHPELADLRWIGADGREQLALARVGLDETGSGRDWSADPRFTGARESGLWLGPVTFRKGSEPHVSLAVASPGAGHVLAADLNLKLVRDLVGRGSSATTYVVDGNSQLIAHPDLGLVLARTDLALLPQVQMALHGRAAGPPHDQAGEPVIATHARIEPLRWTVFVEQPTARALAPVMETLLPTMAIVGLGVAAAVAASIVLAQRLVRPIPGNRGAGAAAGRRPLRGADRTRHR